MVGKEDMGVIDVENEVFNTVATTLRATYNGISVYGEQVETPSSFPSVSLVEDDNSEIEFNKTLARTPETACNLMYTVNVYSNLKSGKKAQAKSIMDTIDARMHDMGFTRTMRNQLPNLDRTIYRVTARYTRTYQTF